MTGSTESAAAVVVAGQLEIRVLLRGLLRLHHFRVLGEAESEEKGLDLVRLHHPKLLVVDSDITEGSIPSLLASARRSSPDLRLVLVRPENGPGVPVASEEADAVLRRPFRVHEFAVAVGAIPPGPAR
jgi:DNA-binding NarL/FixJ family response regulator